MLLSDRDIIRAIDDEELIIDPFDHLLIQPSSIDVSLGNEFQPFNNFLLGYEEGFIDPLNLKSNIYSTKVVSEKWILHPQEFVLATTHEYFEFGSGIAGRLEGKSSLGRLGLEVHSTAGFIDPGFKGNVTLELSNLGIFPIKLTANMLIGQLCIFRLSSLARSPYGSPGLNSKYQNQLGVTGSKYGSRIHNVDTNYV